MITYVALNLTNKKFQIGSTTNFERRCNEHLSGKGDLEFQRSLRKNPQNFWWFVSVDDELETRDEEQFYLDFYFQSELCYNHNPSASCPPNATGRSWKWSEEKRKNICGKGNHRYGKKGGQKQKDSLPRGKDHPGARPMILTHPNGVEEYFNTISEGAKKYDLNAANLRGVMDGVRKQHKNFTARDA